MCHTVLCSALYTACVDASRTVFWDRSLAKNVGRGFVAASVDEALRVLYFILGSYCYKVERLSKNSLSNKESYMDIGFGNDVISAFFPCARLP